MSYYTIDNVTGSSGLNPIPITNASGLPYNMPSTPLLGNPNADTLSSDFLAYYNGTGAFDDIGALTERMANSQSDAYIAATGTGAGERGEATDAFVAKQWQTFFYIFQPFVTNEFFNQTRDSLEDAGVTYSNVTYYTGLFESKFADWMNYRKANNGSGTDAADFRSYLTNHTEMGYRQKCVVFWQFSRILDMLQKLEERTLNAATRQVTWNEGALKAVNTINAREIPAVEPSDEDVRVPDPDSIQAQHNVMMALERDRADQKKSEEKARTDDSIVSFSGDGTSQQKATMQSFWTSLQTVLSSIIN